MIIKPHSTVIIHTQRTGNVNLMRLFISIRSHRTNAHNPNYSFPELTVFPFYNYTVLNNISQFFIKIFHHGITKSESI